MKSPSLFTPLGALILALLAGSPSAAGQLSILRQGPDSTGAAELGDQFGKACAAGDFNGDGLDDVAIGAPSDVFGGGPGFRGSVTVQYGSKHGITWNSAVELRPDASIVPLNAKAWFGQALAAGDFDDDGFADLAVGAPFAAVNGQDEAGLVVVYPGSVNGITGFGQYVLTQADLGIAVESLDRFGWSLAAGAVGSADDVDDLVVGSPGENGFTGLVGLFKGTPGVGLTAAGSEWYTPDLIGATVSSGSRFGYSLAIGNVTGFAPVDVIVGAPLNDVGGVSNSGSAHVILGNNTGLTAFLSTQYDLTDAGRPLEVEARFGWSVVAGAFSADHVLLDLAIGAPGVNGFDGLVAMTEDNDGSLTLSRVLTTSNLTNGSTSSDEYGDALAAGDWDADGDDDLAVGVPGMLKGGEVHVIYGAPGGIDAFEGERFDFTSLGEPDDGDADLGRALCFGDFAQGARQSVVAGAPGFAADTGEAFDIAPWRQVHDLTCETALVANCAGEVLFAMKPHERVKIASTTKIMTALLGCEATARPLNDPLYVALGETYTVEPWMGVAYPPGTLCSVFGLVPGELIRFRDLLRTCVMRSGNDSAFAIADMMTNEITVWNGTVGSAPQFVQLMNDRAAQIGMTNTFFTNPPGVDPGDPYSTAYDMWLLGREAMKNALFADLAGTTDYGFVRQLPGPIMQPVNVSYGTLKSIQGVVPTAIGLKGGGTPGAGSTGVFAARSTSVPFKTVYGLGFGWASSTQRTPESGALLNFGLSTCTPSFAPNPPKPPQPPWVADLPLAAGSSASSNNIISDFAWGNDIVLQIQSLAGRGVPDGSGTLITRHDASFELAPGESAGTTLQGVSSFDGGVILNQSSSQMAFLSLRTVVDGNGSTQTVVLAPMQPHELTAVGIAPGSVVSFELTNVGSALASLGVEHRWARDVTVSSGSTGSPIAGTGVSRSYQASTEGIELILHGSGSSQHPVALVMADAADAFVFDPCIARWNNYGTGWQGSNDEVPGLFCNADPVLGTTVDVMLAPATDVGSETLFLFMGFATLAAPSNKGGTLLVTPEIQVVLPNISSDGVALPLVIPVDPILCGVSLHAQMIHTDAGASDGYAFSRGLTLTFGNPWAVAPQ